MESKPDTITGLRVDMRSVDPHVAEAIEGLALRTGVKPLEPPYVALTVLVLHGGRCYDALALGQACLDELLLRPGHE